MFRHAMCIPSIHVFVVELLTFLFISFAVSLFRLTSVGAFYPRYVCIFLVAVGGSTYANCNMIYRNDMNSTKIVTAVYFEKHRQVHKHAVKVKCVVFRR